MPKNTMARRRFKRGVILIWPQMNGFCSYTGIFSVQKNQIRFLSKIITGINLLPNPDFVQCLFGACSVHIRL
jgi:hypothetical protein